MTHVYDDKHKGSRGNSRNSSTWTSPSRAGGFSEPLSRSHPSRLLSDPRDIEEEVRGRELGRNDEVRLVSLAAKKNHWVPPASTGSGGFRQTQEQNPLSQKAIAKMRDLEEQNKMLRSQVEWLEGKNVDLMNEVRALEREKDDCERKLDRYRRSTFESRPNPERDGVSTSVDTGGDRYPPDREPPFISHRAAGGEFEYGASSWNPPAAEDYRRDHDQQLPYPKRGAEYRGNELPAERETWREPPPAQDDYYQQQAPSRGREPTREQRPAQDTRHHFNPNSRFDREDLADGQNLNQRVGFEHHEETQEPALRRYESPARTEVKQESGPKGWSPIGRDSTHLGGKPPHDEWGGKDVVPSSEGNQKRREDPWGAPQPTRTPSPEEQNSKWSPKPQTSPRQPVHWTPPPNKEPSWETSEQKPAVSRSSFADGKKSQPKSNDRPNRNASAPVRKTEFTDPVTPSSSDGESDTNEHGQRGWGNPGSV